MRQSCPPIHGCLRRVQSTAFSRPPPSTFQYRLEVPGSGTKWTFRSGQFVQFPLFLKFNKRQDSSSFLITQVLATPLGDCNHAPPPSVPATDDICSLQKKVVWRTKSALRLTGCNFVFFQSCRLHGHPPPPLLSSIYDLRPRTAFDGVKFGPKKITVSIGLWIRHRGYRVCIWRFACSLLPHSPSPQLA